MARPKTNNERINLLMPPPTMKALRLLAQQRGTSYSELIRSACREYAVRELTKDREAHGAHEAQTA